MIFSTTTGDPDTVYAVDLPETLRDAAVRAQCPGYRFWSYPGRLSRNARRPAAAQPLDQFVGPVTIAADGSLSAMAADGTIRVVSLKGEPGQPGKDALLPASMTGEATTLGTGKAVLDWSALKLKAAPSRIDVWPIGRAAKLSLDTVPTAAGVTVSAEEDKPQAVVGVSINLAAAGGRPAVGVRLWWTVTA